MKAPTPEAEGRAGVAGNHILPGKVWYRGTPSRATVLGIEMQDPALGSLAPRIARLTHPRALSDKPERD